MSDTDLRKRPISDSRSPNLRLTALALGILLVIAAIPLACRSVMARLLINELLIAVRDPEQPTDFEVRIDEVAEKIEQHGCQNEALAAVLPLLKSPDAQARVGVLLFVYRLERSSPDVTRALVDLWSDPHANAAIREDAAWILMQIDPGSAAEHGAAEVFAAAQAERKQIQRSKMQSAAEP